MSNTFTVFCLVAVLTTSVTSATIENYQDKLDSQDEKIVNGADAQPGQFPYIVSIYKNGQLHCGGSILSPLWVVSAGHCFSPYNPQNDFIVYAGLVNQGELNNNPDVQSRRVAESYVHPNYQRAPQLANDVAMVRLANPLRFHGLVHNIPVPGGNPEIFHGDGVTAGWGYTELGALSPHLKYFSATVLDSNECQLLVNRLDINALVRESNICTKVAALNQHACQGDSGGPLVQNEVLIGVVSWIRGGCETTPTVYARVNSYMDFINSYLVQ